MLVHVVADYGQGDLAFAEVAQRLLLQLPKAQLVYTAVPPFATLAAGFCVAQLALNESPSQMAVFQNVAPRGDDRSARRDNDGERLVCARLADGKLVVGPNSGFAFSFVREAASELHFVKVSSGGSQFRSRDIFAWAFGRIVAGDRTLLGDPVPDAAVPPVPRDSIAYVDGYGNLKTTLGHAGLQPGETVPVRIGEVERTALVAGGGFDVPDGELAFAPGSSGWPLPDGSSVRFRELFLRGGNAWAAFGRPPVGSRIALGVVSS
ncbi:MAG TPA: hypothetical protein VF168_13605 [Trueperaceae bacterium]